jgi:hypothetical protein
VAVEAFDYAWHLAFATRVHDLDAISNSVDKLKQFMTNFVERPPSVPGACPLLNTAIDADDGDPVLRERPRKALREWRDLLSSIINTGIERREIRRGVDVRRLATQSYLERYLETEVRRGKKSTTLSLRSREMESAKRARADSSIRPRRWRGMTIKGETHG